MKENPVKGVYLDYQFRSCIDKGSYQPRVDISFIRRIINTCQVSVHPLNLSNSIRGELEIAIYGREYLVNLDSFQQEEIFFTAIYMLY